VWKHGISYGGPGWSFPVFYGFYKLGFCPFSDASGGGLKNKIYKIKVNLLRLGQSKILNQIHTHA
jgi:hypothetical protein